MLNRTRAKKALIKVGYACNDLCTFCHTEDVRHIDDSARNVALKIDRAAELKHSMVVLSGGEPTIRPELTAWAKRSAARGMDFGLVTNGRMLSYAPLVDKLMELRLGYVYLSLHGGTAKVHNACVRSDAFDETFGGLKELSGRGLHLTANCVITKTNLPHLKSLVDSLESLEDVALQFSMTEPKGGAYRLFEQVVPKVSDVATAVIEAIEHGRSKNMGHRLAHGGIPLCLLPGLENLYGDLKTHDFATMTEVGESDFFPVDDLNKNQPEPCKDCSLRGPCPGLYRVYHENFGVSELQTVHGMRSNSFNYHAEDRLAWKPSDPCPLLGRATPHIGGRTLFLRQPGRLTLFKTDTRDFADSEILKCQREDGQIYVDVSDKTAPDNFAKDLRKLTIIDECTQCPESHHCAQSYRVDPTDVFTRDESVLIEVLKSLKGRVLDIGCGAGRYVESMRDALEDGTIDYTGIDPDGSALLRLQEMVPRCQIEKTDIEHFPMEKDAWDHVLILQSWNHIFEPRKALEKLIGGIRNGGTILIADNVAFGLLRTQKQKIRAERSHAEFEHWRNDRGNDVDTLLNELGIEVLMSRDVSAQTSNQWIRQVRVKKS